MAGEGAAGGWQKLQKRKKDAMFRSPPPPQWQQNSNPPSRVTPIQSCFLSFQS